MAADHVGYSMTWEGRVATITAPDGTSRTMGMRDFRTLREQARSTGAPSPDAGRTDAAPAAGTGDTSPAGAPVVTGGLRIGAPSPRIDQAQGRRVVSRAAVTEAFTREQLAELLVAFSQMLSDADGAGPAGVFSQSEAMLLSGLLHDQTVDLILRRFDGDATRFRAAAALAIIIAGKGRVHLQAIQRGGGLRGLSARRPAAAPPIATVPDSLPVAPDVPAPWAGIPVEAPVMSVPEPAPPAPPAPAPSGPVLDRPSVLDGIFG